MMSVGIILAGGLSRRMGGVEKSLIQLGNKTLLEHVRSRAERQLANLAINANGDLTRFDFTGLPVIADPIEGHAGPLAGVLAGLQWAKVNTQATHILTVAADTPFFPEDIVSTLERAAANQPDNTIALASSGGRIHPVFGLWAVSVCDDLELFLTTLDNRKVLAFVDRHNLVEVHFESSGGMDPFFNINTPDDLALAQEWLTES